MQQALKDERFRQHVREFIKSTIHADIDNKPREAILQMPKRHAPSYSRPINPIQFPVESEQETKELACTLQFHRCNTTMCLLQRNGHLECKRKAPFALSPQEWVNADGEWGPKRMCTNLNNWNPWIMRCIRANHDTKLIMNRAETCVLLLYITNYAFKKQNRSSNASALIARQLAFHQTGQSQTAFSNDD